MCGFLAGQEACGRKLSGAELPRQEIDECESDNGTGDDR
jgi:hypothetical protein